MKKIIEQLKNNQARRDALIENWEQEGCPITVLVEQQNIQEGYELAIIELEELIKGGKHED